MRDIRGIVGTYPAKATREGAGVRLHRAFGFSHLPLFDPFLMLDDLRATDPEQYRGGFPWHPHRGMETVTYLMRGDVEHADSLGNAGVIGPGCAQWMTAGGGIIHQETLRGDSDGVIAGFQLWANLPAVDKMMKPRYQEISDDEIPLLITADGVAIRIIAGTVGDITGPVRGIRSDPEFLDVTVPPGTRYEHPTVAGHTVFAYVISGEACFADHIDADACASDGSAVLFDDGEFATVVTGGKPVRFLLCSGKPLHEPIAWAGPIVMNTQTELDAAFSELEDGTFVQPVGG